jgi:hypothetical protein
MDRIKKLAETLRMMIESGFTGYIKINFSQGSIGRIEKSEELEHDDIQHPEEKIAQTKENVSP